MVIDYNYLGHHTNIGEKLICPKSCQDSIKLKQPSSLKYGHGFSGYVLASTYAFGPTHPKTIYLLKKPLANMLANANSLV